MSKRKNLKSLPIHLILAFGMAILATFVLFLVLKTV